MTSLADTRERGALSQVNAAIVPALAETAKTKLSEIAASLKESAARLRHPLYSADQLAAAITAERTRCAAIARKHGAEDAAREMES